MSRTSYRSSSIQRPIVQRRIESSVGPSKQSLKPRVSEIKGVSSYMQPTISSSTQARYSSIVPNYLCRPKHCSNPFKDLTPSFKALSLNDECRKDKENRPDDCRNEYFNNYTTEYNRNFKKNDDFSTSTATKYPLSFENKTTSTSSFNKPINQDTASFRIASNTILHPSTNIKSNRCYSIDPPVKPTYRSTVYDNVLEVSAAARNKYSQLISPVCPITIAAKPPTHNPAPQYPSNLQQLKYTENTIDTYIDFDKVASSNSNFEKVPQKLASSSSKATKELEKRSEKPSSINSVPEDPMIYQQPKDFMRNVDTFPEKVSSINYSEEITQKPLNSSTNSANKQSNASEYSESKTYTKSDDRKQFIERGGLPNNGLTCYLNSILQCLFASEPLMEHINNIERPGKVTTLFMSIYEYTLAPRDCSDRVVVRDLLRDIAITLGFVTSRVDDAHAFYMTLVERLMEEDHSLDKFFVGEFYVTAECKSCGVTKPFEESFTELALPSKRQCSKRDLAACIDFCFKPKRLECCKCHSEKVRKPALICAPEILVLFLEKNAREDTTIKELISIPMDEKRIGYSLLGIVDYYGSGSFGHYTAITWNQKKRRLFCYDDLNVSEYSLRERFVNNSLLCFYEKA